MRVTLSSSIGSYENLAEEHGIQEHEGVYTDSISMEADRDSGELYVEAVRSDGSLVIYTIKDGAILRVVKWCPVSPENTERVVC